MPGTRRNSVLASTSRRCWNTIWPAFLEAGLGEPQLFLHAPLGCSAAWAGYDWSAQSMRSLLPLLETYGIVTAGELDVDTLAERYWAEVVRTGCPFMMLPLVTAWAHTPAG